MRFILGAIILSVAAPASASVVHAGSNGFESAHETLLVAPPERAWQAIERIGGWWADSHTYSGKAVNLSLQARAGGCFCERVPEDGGSVEHMRVSYVAPGKRLVMTGSLGPLLYEATTGVMDIQLTPTGGGSKLTVNYRASGFHRGDAAKTAPLVDRVLAEQVKRLRAYVAGGGGR